MEGNVRVNFCLDREGREIPIRYKAAELVNKPAPDGYHWQLRNAVEDSMQGGMFSMPFTGPESNYDYYIAVKDEQP
jgi:hypothetical protein